MYYYYRMELKWFRYDVNASVKINQQRAWNQECSAKYRSVETHAKNITIFKIT